MPRFFIPFAPYLFVGPKKVHKISRPGAYDLTAIVPTKAVHTRYEKPRGRPTATFNEIILQLKGEPRAQTLALRPRLGLVLWGLAGLEERPERHVVLQTRLAALLAPGPRGLARVDDGRAGLHLLVLPVGED